VAGLGCDLSFVDIQLKPATVPGGSVCAGFAQWPSCQYVAAIEENHASAVIIDPSADYRLTHLGLASRNASPTA
jgi:hypothetical protein